MMFGCGLAVPTHAGNPRHDALVETLLAVDAQFEDASQVAAARQAFDGLARAALPCADRGVAREDRSGCVISTLFASGQIAAVAEPGDPGSSTLTSPLVSRRGNCAALTALALAVADRIDVPMEAVVFPKHVVVRDPKRPDQVFELLQRGLALTMPQLRHRLGADGAHDTRVRSRDFPAYYLDNFAVRFAEAGDSARAERMFTQAIEAGPRVARIRFNYGTYLLEKNRLETAEAQLRRAVHLDAHNAPAWANLGVAVARLGDKAEARRCFERAIHADPGNRTAAENLKALGRDGSPPPR